MDKSKLIQIIEKELEELKVLSEEVAENENDTTLIIEIALSKSRLLYQEFELLRELTAKEVSVQTDDLPEDNVIEQDDVDEDEISDVNISDPEIEIVEFEEQELVEDQEPKEEEEDMPNIDEEDIEDNFEEEEINSEVLEEEPEGDENEEPDEDMTDSDIKDEKELEEEGLIEFDENEEDEEENDEDEEDDYHHSKSNIESNELNTDMQSEFREITIDLDEDEIEPVKISAASETTDRPVMREIPKPEELVMENPVEKESFKKGNSLNDSIGETKSPEPTLANGPITSLRAAIGLNDRFLFIREIFANNTDKYNTVIDKLDKLETIQQAVDYLKANLTLQKNETSMKFVDLLKRRFSK